MSAGHPHRRPNARHAAELAALRRDPAVARRLAQYFRVDLAHDIADLAGYSTDGATIYIDRHLAAALHARQMALPDRAPLPAGRIVLRALITHECVEKALIDAKNFSYPAAHEFATLAEHEIVRAAVEAIRHPPKNLDCTPYLDDPDHNDRRVLAILRRLGVRDAARRPEHDHRRNLKP